MGNRKFDNEKMAVLKIEVETIGEKVNGNLTIKGNQKLLLMTMANLMQENVDFRRMVTLLANEYKNYEESRKEATHEK